jgi:hypothetical protein
MWGNVFCTSQHFAPPRDLPSRRETKHYPPLPPCPPFACADYWAKAGSLTL